MKPTIEQPKVFISYAWGTTEYQDKVLAFAEDLVGDGIDVVLDRWSLKEGNDTYAFMEQSVTDPTITNVLLLLDPIYQEKANGRSGGVGTETQIISPEIYNKVKQEKFLPIIFEKGENGEVPKPQYLRGMLHFDLSCNDTYNLEYRRLVKRLYGIEIIRKPKIGNRPNWLEENIINTKKTVKEFEILKKQENGTVNVKLFRDFLEKVKQKIIDLKDEETEKDEEYIGLYEKTKPIRDEFLQLTEYMIYVPKAYEIVADVLESINLEMQNKIGNSFEIAKTLLHEMFVYIVAIYLKQKEYQALEYTLNRTYFSRKYGRDEATSFDVFYDYNEKLDRAVCLRDNKRYHSGTAKYWIDNINIEACNKNEFVLGDIFCYNASIFIGNYESNWYWFPITYVYMDRQCGNIFKTLAVKLKSKEHLQIFSRVFGEETVEEFKSKYRDIQDKMKTGKLQPYRYDEAFENAPILCEYLSDEELGTRN